MREGVRKLAVAAAVAGIIIGTSGTAWAGTAPRAMPACPGGFTCYPDPVDFIDTSPTSLNQFEVSDPSNATQFSVGVGAAVSWANPFCVTNNALTDHSRLMYVACLGGTSGNGQGRPDLTLTENDGVLPTVTLIAGGQRLMLTPALLKLLIAEQAAGITQRDLRLLGRWLHARGM